MTLVSRIILLISVFVCAPLAAQATAPARDETIWSLIDTSGKVVKSDVGEHYWPNAETNVRSKVLVSTAMVDGRSVFQTVDAKDHHVLATFPPDLVLSYAVDPSGLVVILRMEKNKYGADHFVYGFAKVTGEIVVPAQYDSAGPFGPNGLAPVSQDQRFGFIDTKGKLRIPLQFIDAKMFGDNGLAPVKTSAGWGYIDSNGVFVIQPQYTGAKPFNGQGLAPAANGHWGYIDQTGAFVISPQFDDAWAFWPDGTALVKFAGKDKTFIDRQFGPWILKAVVTPAPEHPYFGPDPWAYVEVTGKSADQALTWTFHTHGVGLSVETQINASGDRVVLSTMPDFPPTDSDFINILVTDIGLLFAQDPPAEQKYKADIMNHRADLLEALSAMRSTSSDLWGKQSKPCLPPDCVY